jgi:hypothetical protein
MGLAYKGILRRRKVTASYNRFFNTDPEFVVGVAYQLLLAIPLLLHEGPVRSPGFADVVLGTMLQILKIVSQKD